jgi:hypothetical protein
MRATSREACGSEKLLAGAGGSSESKLRERFTNKYYTYLIMQRNASFAAASLPACGPLTGNKLC